MIKILPADHPSLGHCIIASFRENGPMHFYRLCESLPLYKKLAIWNKLQEIPHKKRPDGRIELV